MEDLLVGALHQFRMLRGVERKVMNVRHFNVYGGDFCDAAQHIALRQVNGVLYTGRRHAVDHVAGEILQDDLLDAVPRPIEVDIRVLCVLPRR